jgi:predicted protein tyrosine phosphatase
MNHILFICSANKDRSRTAEDHFSSKYPEIMFDSAGTNKGTCEALGTNYLVEKHLLWADHIYVMESKHVEEIKKRFGSKFYNKLTVVDIKDHYKYGDADLIRILEKKVDLSRL